jgi:hypothetical protein
MHVHGVRISVFWYTPPGDYMGIMALHGVIGRLLHSDVVCIVSSFQHMRMNQKISGCWKFFWRAGYIHVHLTLRENVR